MKEVGFCNYGENFSLLGLFYENEESYGINECIISLENQNLVGNENDHLGLSTVALNHVPTIILDLRITLMVSKLGHSPIKPAYVVNIEHFKSLSLVFSRGMSGVYAICGVFKCKSNNFTVPNIHEFPISSLHACLDNFSV
jgi:hypothetical protein